MRDDRHRWRALALLLRSSSDLEAAFESAHVGHCDALTNKILDARCRVRDTIRDAIADLSFSEAQAELNAAGALLSPPFSS